MNVPAIAKRSFDELQGKSEYSTIVNFVLHRLSKLSDKLKRARFIHKIIDEYNEEIFSHPIVKQLSPCSKGCTACCHTQVSVTEDEAELLAHLIKSGVNIDLERFKIQMNAKDDSRAFYSIKYEDRRCVFLGQDGSCEVYEDRPSVCRTNAVLGEASQCDTKDSIGPTRLIKTPKADMAIYASYLYSKSSGSLAHMVGKILGTFK